MILLCFLEVDIKGTKSDIDCLGYSKINFVSGSMSDIIKSELIVTCTAMLCLRILQFC